MTFMIPLRNINVIQDSSRENIVKSTKISKIPKPSTIYMNLTESCKMFLTPLRNNPVIQDSNLENLIKSTMFHISSRLVIRNPVKMSLHPGVGSLIDRLVVVGDLSS